jgi:anti-sigma factor RsiW
MNCEEITRLTDGYLDGELDPIANQAIEEHLQSCLKCAETYSSHRALIRAMQTAAPYYKAPAELRERIHSLLGKEDGEPLRRPTAELLPHPSLPEKIVRPSFLKATPWNWLAIAAAVIFAAIIAFQFGSPARRGQEEQFLATELIASHVRSLMANHLADVASTDQHTVKPWLDAKLDFAPAVVDLAADGFPLIGGRLDYLDKRPVAALVYKRREHFINLFVWPSDAGTQDGTKELSRQGYQLLHWGASDLNYWAVSDVSADDLRLFRQQFAERTSPH